MLVLRRPARRSEAPILEAGLADHAYCVVDGGLLGGGGGGGFKKQWNGGGGNGGGGGGGGGATGGGAAETKAVEKAAEAPKAKEESEDGEMELDLFG